MAEDMICVLVATNLVFALVAGTVYANYRRLLRRNRDLHQRAMEWHQYACVWMACWQEAESECARLKRQQMEAGEWWQTGQPPPWEN